MANPRIPRAFFHFDGLTSGIEVCSFDAWPTNGYSFCAWIRAESFSDPLKKSSNASVSPKQKYHPRLYSFTSDDGCGTEAYFTTSCQFTHLVVRTKRFLESENCTAAFKFDFKPKLWYFLTITHTWRLVGWDTLSLYINGELKESVDLKYPNPGKPLVCCYIGKNTVVNTPYLKIPRSCSFFGQMAAIYLCMEALPAEKVREVATT